MSSITLHPEFGVNPHLTVCRYCGKDGKELMLIGNRTNKLKCLGCGILIFGHRRHEPCPNCGQRDNFEHRGTIAEGEKLPTVCDECLNLIKTGIRFICDECKGEGVIKADTEFAKEFKKAHPEAGGIRFAKCEHHGPLGGGTE